MAYTNQQRDQQGGFGGMLSPQQIKEYTEIFLKYKKQLEEPLLKEERIYTTCVNPDCESRKGGSGGNVVSPEFYIESGFYMCESCDSLNGRALGYYDLKE